MKRRLFIFILLFLTLNLQGAEDAFLKDFPAIVLTGYSKQITESFNTSGATKDLYAKYYGFARMIKTGDMAVQKKHIKAMLDEDVAIWTVETERKFCPPKKPTVPKDSKNAKKILAAYDKAVTKAQEPYDKKIAIAKTYLNWLSVEIPAWVEKVK